MVGISSREKGGGVWSAIKVKSSEKNKKIKQKERKRKTKTAASARGMQLDPISLWRNSFLSCSIPFPSKNRLNEDERVLSRFVSNGQPSGSFFPEQLYRVQRNEL